ncbi:Crp/Fnr family transcriptional regulator [Maribacter algicola]|uniref:Crp/Fnr family transcriptional regulator n=1 Tax=Meishania litoralis TaxID=3434685 RepID=A0ACC7LLS4_9FLAO
MDNGLLLQVYEHPLLSREEIGTICALHKKVYFRKGDFVLKEGLVADEYLILEEGLARSFVYDYNGNDITTNFFAQNEIIIEVSSLFQRIPSKENIQVLTDCICWKIDFDDFQNIYHSIAGFSEWGRAWMSQSLFESKQRAISMITDSAMKRYHKLLEEKPLVIQNAPLKHIASYLGITDSSLSRIRKATART